MSSPRTPFSLAEWSAIGAILLVWGLNNVAAKVATEVVPPLFMGGARFTVALLLLIPFLRPPWPPWREILPLLLVAGPLHYGLVYIAFAMVEDLSPIVVALQLWIPMTALLSWLLLKEPMPLLAAAGLAIAFGGVAYMSLDPQTRTSLPGLGVSVCASLLWALATVFMRRAATIRPVKLQAYTSLTAAPVLLAASLMFEPGGVQTGLEAGWLIWGLIIFAAVASTIGATALMFWLIQRHEAGRVTPWFLLTPLVSCSLGVLVLGDVLTPQVLIGGVATLAGVALVALTERRTRLAATEEASPS